MSDTDLTALDAFLSDVLPLPVDDQDAIAHRSEAERTERITVRLQPSEKNQLLLDARGIPLSQYVRSRLLGYGKPAQPILAPQINRDLYVELLRLHQLIEQQFREAQGRQQQGLDSDWSDRTLTLHELKCLIIELRKEVVALSTQATT